MDNRTNYSFGRWNVVHKNVEMLKLFKKKTEVEKLKEKHKKLLEEAHQLSSVNRRKSDQKISESEEVLKRIREITG